MLRILPKCSLREDWLRNCIERRAEYQRGREESRKNKGLGKESELSGPSSTTSESNTNTQVGEPESDEHVSSERWKWGRRLRFRANKREVEKVETKV
jgi:hypothetical protein